MELYLKSRYTARNAMLVQFGANSKLLFCAKCFF